MSKECKITRRQALASGFGAMVLPFGPSCSPVKYCDPAVYDFLSSGTPQRLPGFGIEDMSPFLKRLRPSKLEHLMAVYALYRPGPLEQGMLDSYVEARHGRKAVHMAHPLLAPFARETYGVFVYTEQLEQAIAALAGITLEQAEDIQHDIRRHSLSRWYEVEDVFVSGARRNGVLYKDGEAIFDEICETTKHLFPRDYAERQAQFAYQVACFMVHHPKEYEANFG